MKLPSAPLQWLLLALAAVGLVALWRSCAPDADTPIIPPRTDSLYREDTTARARTDSLRAVRTAEADSLRREIRARDVAVLRAKTRAATAAAEAGRAATVARLAGDTLSRAWSAYQAESTAHIATRTALAVVTEQKVTGDAALLSLQIAYDTTAAELERSRLVTDALREAVDIAASRQRCRIAGLVPCPSRRQALLGGVVVGAVGILALTAR